MVSENATVVTNLLATSSRKNDVCVCVSMFGSSSGTFFQRYHLLL